LLTANYQPNLTYFYWNQYGLVILVTPEAGCLAGKYPKSGLPDGLHSNLKF
jgi:hypothetical protein